MPPDKAIADAIFSSFPEIRLRRGERKSACCANGQHEYSRHALYAKGHYSRRDAARRKRRRDRLRNKHRGKGRLKTFGGVTFTKLAQ